MRSWMIYIVLVVATIAVLWLLATSFPSISTGVFLVGTPIVVVGAGLGAKLVQSRRKAVRSERP